MSLGASGRYAPSPASATRVPADWAAAGVTRGAGMRAALAAAMTINDRHVRQRLLSLIGELLPVDVNVLMRSFERGPGRG
jgi:hypothetical protein